MTKIDKQEPETGSKRKAEVDEKAGSNKHSKSNENSPSKAAKHDKTGEQSDGVRGLLMPCPSARKASVHEANSSTYKSSKQREGLLSTAGIVEKGQIYFFYRPRCALHGSTLVYVQNVQRHSITLCHHTLCHCRVLLWSTQNPWMMCRGSL